MDVALGGVDIHKISGQSELFVSYTGGGMFSTGSSNAATGVVQELSFKDTYSLRRSTLSVFDQLNYLPESSFGFAGTAGAGLPGVATGGGIGSGFTPGQSILTPEGQNLSNAFDLELDTKLTSRSSLTFVGGYSLLRFFDDNLANYGDATFQAGYNYQVTRKDTVAVSYNFSAFRYSNVDQSLNLNTIGVPTPGGLRAGWRFRLPQVLNSCRLASPLRAQTLQQLQQRLRHRSCIGL